VYEFPQLALVRSEAVGCVKTAKAAAAQRAAAFFIQGKSVHERSPATYAEKLGRERLGRLQTSLTYREANHLAQNFAANTAGIWKYEGKKGVKG
jgi:hypothetical protein